MRYPTQNRKMMINIDQPFGFGRQYPMFRQKCGISWKKKAG